MLDPFLISVFKVHAQRAQKCNPRDLDPGWRVLGPHYENLFQLVRNPKHLSEQQSDVKQSTADWNSFTARPGKKCCGRFESEWIFSILGLARWARFCDLRRRIMRAFQHKQALYTFIRNTNWKGESRNSDEQFCEIRAFCKTLARREFVRKKSCSILGIGASVVLRCSSRSMCT